MAGYIPTKEDKQKVRELERLMPYEEKARQLDQLAHFSERQGATGAEEDRKKADEYRKKLDQMKKWSK